jgi:dihydrofolate reductase
VAIKIVTPFFRRKYVAMNINLIWAQARNRVIGMNGVMPWHLPEDLAHLKRATLGAHVIMGRKTWESIPPKFRPLPNRTNIVISRQTDFLAGQVGFGLQTAKSLQAALDMASQHSDIWVIGGAQIYEQALPLASKAIVTEIDADFAGDTFAPKLGSEWIETARESHTATNGLRYAFVTFERIKE